MPISGYIGAGAQQALDQVLDRRLKEQIRQQQEKEHADQIAIQRQQIDLQQRRDAAIEKERAEDRLYRQGQVERDDASTLASTLDPGEVTSAQAAMLQKHPGIAPRVSQRQIIDARPIAAQSVLPGKNGAALGGEVTASVDPNAPKEMSVFAPTPAQAKEQLRTVNLRRISDTLKGATTEQQRRAAGAEGFGAGIDVPNNLLGQTGEEKTAQELAAEARTNAEWERRNNITNAQATARETAQQNAIADRAKAANTPDPAAQVAQRDQALDFAKRLRGTKGLSAMTGAAGPSYLWGLKDEPVRGTNAATAKKYFSSLQALLTLPKLSYLKGPMSDKDIEFVKAASEALHPDMDDATFVAELDKIIEKLENPTGAGWQDRANGPGGGGALAPGTKVTIGGNTQLGTDTLSELQRRRALQKPR